MSKEFIIDLGNERAIKVKATRKREVTNDINFRNRHYAYTIVVEMDGNKFNFTFHDSNYHYCNRHELDIDDLKDAMYCYLMDADAYDSYRDIKDFKNAFGYNKIAGVCTKAYYACEKAYDTLVEMFTMEELEVLREKVSN